MKMLVDTIHLAGSNPYSWGIVAMIGAVALYSVYKYRACPYLCHKRKISEAESVAAGPKPYAAGTRFVVVMLAGISAILVGLSMLSSEANPPLALLLIVAGVFAVQVEPANVQIQDAVRRVVAAQIEGPEAVMVAEDRLRTAHFRMVLTSIAIFGAVIAALLAF